MRFQLTRGIKLAISVLLLLFAALQCLLRPGAYAGWLLAGMAASTAGDALLSPSQKLRARLPLPDPLPLGMGCFLLAHLAYFAAFATRGFSWGTFAAAWPLIGGGCSLVWARSMRHPENAPALEWATLSYLWVICAMTAAALCMALRHGGAAWLAVIGGALFIISDGIIGLTALGRRTVRNADEAIWGTYVPAQVAIQVSRFF